MNIDRSIEASIRWAREYVLASQPVQYGSDLWACLNLGSRAVVAILDIEAYGAGDDDLAAFYAEGAAHAAHRAIPELRE